MVIAEHCPRPDVPTCIREAALVPEPAGALVLDGTPTRAAMPVPARAPVPTSPGRFAVQFMLDAAAHAELEYARAHCRYAVPTGDFAEFYKWAVREAIKQGEKRAFAVTSRPRASKSAPKCRTVPAEMKRQVGERGGETTVENLRLRCRGHNQYEAEQTFGAGFMARKRAEAREQKRDVSEQSPTLVPEPALVTITEQAAAEEAIRAQHEEIVPYLRHLGCKVGQVERGAAMCDHRSGEPLAVRVKFAIQQLGRARFERCTVRPGPA